MVVRLCGTSESTDVRNNALQMLREAIASSTSSMTAVPKPLKFLRPHYGGMKDTFRALDAKVRARRGRAEQMGQRRQANLILASHVLLCGSPAHRPGPLLTQNPLMEFAPRNLQPTGRAVPQARRRAICAGHDHGRGGLA